MFALLLLCTSLVWAAPEPVLPPPPPDQAEYVRLQQELEKLVTRGAWAGVERTFQAMIGTRVALQFEDWVSGAYAARALGDVRAVRERLLAANALHEDRAVLDWLWEVDSTYGRVYLAVDPGKGTLEADQMPFDPNQARAVEFAVTAVTDTGLFDGYLPQGQYSFCGTALRVEPRVQAVRIDRRTEAGLREAEKAAAREEKRKEKEGEP